MEMMEFFAVLIVTGAVLIIINRYFTMQENIARLKAAKEARISVQNRNAAMQRGKAPSPSSSVLPGDELGSWVPALLEGFGIDPEVLFDEEMPQELKTFMPIIKGYVQAQGGLPGIAAKLQGGAQSDDQDARQAI